MAPRHVAVQRLEIGNPLFRLCPFRNHLQPEALCQLRNQAHYLLALIVGFHFGYKDSINLQAVDGESRQAAQRRVPGSEIVDAEPDAQCLQSESRSSVRSASPIAMVSTIPG